MDIPKLIRSFGFAFKGIFETVRSQQNMQIHVIAAVLVIIAGLFFGVSFVEWCLLIFAIGIVMAAELFNTTIENLTDLVSPEKNPLAGKAKDAAAGAVLMTAITAALIGILVFGKYLLRYL